MWVKRPEFGCADRIHVWYAQPLVSGMLLTKTVLFGD
jgi:hypothetical protein